MEPIKTSAQVFMKELFLLILEAQTGRPLPELRKKYRVLDTNELAGLCIAQAKFMRIDSLEKGRVNKNLVQKIDSSLQQDFDFRVGGGHI